MADEGEIPYKRDRYASEETGHMHRICQSRVTKLEILTTELPSSEGIQGVSNSELGATQ